MHLTDVSDCHCVASHPVSPCLARPVYNTSPMLAPCTVIDVDPVPAPLSLRVMLRLGTSTDHASVTLPPVCPAVITTRRVPLAPCTVTDVDPVPARFLMRVMLIDPRSDDHA